MEVLVKMLGINKEKDLRVWSSYEYDSRKYTLQEEGKCPSQLRVWYETQIGHSLVRRDKIFIKFLASEDCITLHKLFKNNTKVKDTRRVCTQEKDMKND